MVEFMVDLKGNFIRNFWDSSGSRLWDFLRGLFRTSSEDRSAILSGVIMRFVKSFFFGIRVLSRIPTESPQEFHPGILLGFLQQIFLRWPHKFLPGILQESLPSFFIFFLDSLRFPPSNSIRDSFRSPFWDFYKNSFRDSSRGSFWNFFKCFWNSCKSSFWSSLIRCSKCKCFKSLLRNFHRCFLLNSLWNYSRSFNWNSSMSSQ